MNTPSVQQPTFFGLGIAPRLLDAIGRLGFDAPTPIQKQSIPAAIEGKDVVGVAQTGTGKTLAFTVPMIQRLAREKGTGLVILPTRELALQVDEEMQKIGREIGLRTAVLIGGQPLGRQIEALKKRPHMIIATPGRLLDHMEQKTVRLDTVSILVLDEADRMLDMGFAPQLNRILAAVPPADKRQTMLFSATMPDAIMQIARKHMRLPVRIEVARSGSTIESVEQEVFIVQKQDKVPLLQTLLKQVPGSVLIFMRTKHTAKRLTRSLKAGGQAAAEIHSNRSLAQRRDALDGFKNGKYRILVATDIAARGIDVRGIELVVNYDLPSQAEDYVHRIGRTGRAGAGGRAVSFAMPDQNNDVRAIERLIRRTLRVSALPDFPRSAAAPFPAMSPVSRPIMGRPGQEDGSRRPAWRGQRRRSRGRR